MVLCSVRLSKLYSTIFSYHTVDVSNRFEQLSELSSCFSSISNPVALIAASSPNVNTTESFGCSSVNTLSSSNTGSQSTLLPCSRSQRKKSQPVRLLNLNAQSIRNKKAEFCNLIETTAPDIIVCTETWLNSNIATGEIFPPDLCQQYNVFSRGREQSQGEGVFVAVSRS